LSQVFASWSGGKDGCLACYRAVASGLKIRRLANMITEDGKRSRTHGVSAHVLQIQSQAIGIPLVQRRTTWHSYEAKFKSMLCAFRREGITGGVFGDIDLNEHREWVERVCQEVDITPYLPLWGESQNEILKDFIKSGFKAIVVATKADMLGEEWLGREVDLNFINRLAELRKTKDITLCGEAGEYHTLVVDGPLFQKRMEIVETREVFRDEHWFLDILGIELKAK
jgi:diphthine-ammonia ligase